ncbi:amino acid adenylation domain-containing protein [Yinghuangia sp. ASG 101]|uniref:non-ribosomal peptide synthetase n=1 Tax=Yinghuangia sp. ASG 101 TaxID=2896848 RepID=UPI001E3DF1CB|nr:non-ribosomal peptide synthetase [Yinghuangia sp. ASG 101]UGQ10829.1 amino acid adenylation domain-containing protein [Yinghuangia sp. ASG 101]
MSTIHAFTTEPTTTPGATPAAQWRREAFGRATATVRVLAAARGAADSVRTTVPAALRRHDALDEVRWCGEFAVTAGETGDAGALAAAEQAVGAAIDDGASAAAAWVDRGAGADGLLVVALSTARADATSWVVLVPELRSALGAPEEADTSPAGPAHRDYAAVLAAEAEADDLVDRAAPWLELADRVDELGDDGPAEPWVSYEPFDAEAAAARDTGELVTSWVEFAPAAGRTTEVPDAVPRESLLSAAVRALARSAAVPGRHVFVDVAEDDRDRHDGRFARTVGDLRRVFPVLLDLPAGSDDEVAGPEAVRASVPADAASAAGFGTALYLGRETSAALADAAQPGVLLEYGRTDFGDGPELRAADASFDAQTNATAPSRYALRLGAWTDPARGLVRLTATADATALPELDAAALVTAWRDALEPLLPERDSAGASRDIPAPRASDTSDTSDASHAPDADSDPDLIRTLDAALGGPGVAEVLPLSPLQEGLLFHLLMGGEESDIYVQQAVLLLDGPVRPTLLAEAARRVLEKYPNLRAGFVTVDDVTRQVVPERFTVPFTYADLTDDGVPPVDVDAAFEVFADSEREEPFDPVRPPLIRFGLARVGETAYRLVMTSEVALVDGWSGGLLLTSLLESYTDAEAELARPVTPFRAHLEWLAGRDRDRASDAWRTYLADLEEPTLLADGGRTGVGATLDSAREFRRELPADLVARLTARAREAGVTVGTLYETAWGVLLGRLTGRDDVTFGSLVSGRHPDVDGVETTVGLLFNTVPVRLRVRPAESPRELWRRVQDEKTDLLDHQYLGLSDIQAGAGLGPLFDTFFVFQNLRLPDKDRGFGPDGGVRVVGHTVRDATHYPLSFVVSPGQVTRLRAMYHEGVFDRAEADALADRYTRVLEAFADAPGRRCADIDVLSAAERRRVLVEWNDTARPVPDLTIADLLEERAARSPDDTAVVQDPDGPTPTVWTYRELNERANRIARLLRAQGAAPEKTVALALPRTADMVAALFAVLKTGAAYLPLELDLPDDRIAYMLADTNPVCVLTTTAALPGVADAVRLDAPAVRDGLDALSGADLTDAERPDFVRSDARRLDHPAYVIYTSGSTGRPKGVVTPYRGLTNMQYNHRHHIFDPVVTHATRRLRIAHTVSFAFDMSWEELLWLVEGHEVHVCDEELRRDAHALTDYINRHHIDVINVTPTYAEHLLDEGLLESDPANGRHRPRLVLLGGEAVSDAVWSALRDTDDVLGYNLYGPTEYTINTLGAGTTDSHTPTIGTPIWNTTTHILDHHLQPVPPGTPGELYITGTGLARGYLNNPTLTAQRFTANPYGPPGTRLYRTGDLARQRPDGTIDYLGRTDDQIKIRGHRIEPTEIQTIIGTHPEILQNAVVPTAAADGSVQLTAYVVPADPDATPEDAEDAPVRARLAESEAEQVAEWRQIYADEYTEINTAVFTEDFAGWDSSYDGGPIPVPHMREWRDETVSRIAALRPRRVLEIGVGTGLILGRIAPLCEAYWGTDFAAPVIAKLRRELDDRDPALAAKVELRTAAAHDLSAMPTGFFDTVVVNSVIQYFPSAAYLTGVLRQALDLVVPGGSVFIGDVRNLRLIRAFHTAIHLGQAASDADDGPVRAAIERGVLLEKELLIDPDYFAALAEQLPQLGGVDLRIKRGHHHNELSRHRFDVVLHRRPVTDATPLHTAPTLAWRSDDPGQLDALAARLRDDYPATLRVTGVPNARLSGELGAVRVLENGGTVADARAALRSAPAGDGSAPLAVEPEVLYALGENHGYVVAATWTPGAPGAFDAVFSRPEGADTAAVMGTYAVSGARRGSLAAYANSPAAGRNAGTFVPRLRAYLRERLPEYMVPSTFVVLDRLPLTVNGKLDREALPAPDAGAGRKPGRAAATPAEKALCLLFAEVLGVADVGAEDSFFDLGGHSLLAARLAAKARATLGVDLAIRDVFGAPTPAALAERVSPEDAGPARPVPAPRTERGPVALSFAQRRLWLLSQFDTASAAYHEPIAARMRGRLDLAALRAAVQDVTDRHETLRTLCVESDASEDGVAEVFQHVLSPEQARTTVEFTDLVEPSSADGRADETRVAAAVAEATRRPFDLAVDLPLRVTVFAVGPDEHIMLSVFHHIAFDEWSVRPFAQDFSAAYTARCRGEAPSWEHLPVQYADYTVWQRDLLGDPADPSSRQAAQLAYWRETLAGAPEEVPLPADRPRPSVASYRGGTVESVVPAELADRLREIARAAGASPFMLFQSAVATLLHRLGGGEDIPLGSPVAGRDEEAFADLIGFFVNTVVIRADLSGNPAFGDVLARVRDTALAAFAHQDLPFERLVEELNPVRSLARNPLFQIMVGHQNQNVGEVRFGEIAPTVERFTPTTAKFDLDFIFREADQSLERGGPVEIGIEYSADLFDHGTCAALARRLIRLLEQIAADPTRRIGEFDVLSAAERRRVLVEWNDTARPVPDLTIADLLEERAARSPDDTAVVQDPDGPTPTVWTYRELNERANRIARLLRAQGAAPEKTVALALPRTADMVAALFAVLKTGAAYLPLELDLPDDRIAYMLADTNPVCVLTTTAALPGVADAVRLDAPAVRDGLDALSGADLTDAERPDFVRSDARRLDHPAYVIYTSGSTGRPKGVVTPYRGLTNMQYNHRHHIFDPVVTHATRRLRIAHTVSFAFDMSWEELLWLVEGHEVHVCDEELRRDAHALTDYINRHHIDVINVTPTYAEHLLDEGLLESDPANGRHRPRLVLLGGEAVSDAVWSALRDTDDVLGYNLYGPTEYTINTLGAGTTDSHTPTIGTPIWNTTTHILDHHLQPVPPGTPGELYITGTGLARGYLNNPTLTAQRFTANPYGPPGTRLYRTGDLARQRPDGTIDYLGRTDDQIKIRGHRIEPTEIQTIIGTHPEILQNAVVPTHEGTALTAYVVGTADPATLRAWLSARLPDYMVPSAFVRLDALPLTVNGKLDRAALPVPDLSASVSSRGPRDEHEAALCRAFAETLDLPRVGVDDDFFALGGHSLLAVRLVGAIRRAGVVADPTSVTVATVMTSPTPAALADRLRTDRGADPSLAPLLALRPDGDLPPLFCVHPGFGLAWSYAALLPHVEPERPVYGLQSPILSGGPAPERFEDLVDAYVRRVRTVQPHGPYHLLGWSFGGGVAHAVACVLQRDGEDVRFLALLDAEPAVPLPPDTAAGFGDDDAREHLRRAVSGPSADDPGAPDVAAELGDEVVAALLRARTAHEFLVPAVPFGPYQGDILCVAVRANADRTGRAAWTAHCDGSVRETAVDHEHDDLLSPSAVDDLGPLLRRGLDATHPQEGL